MKKIRVLSVLTAMLMLVSAMAMFSGCKDDKKDTKDSSVVKDDFDYASKTADDLLKEIKDVENITVDEYAWLMSTYQYVSVTDTLMLEENITDEAFNKLYEMENSVYPDMQAVFDILIESESPQVRGSSMDLAYSLFGVNDDNINKIMEVVKDEKDPFVLNCAVNALANEGSTSPEIGEFLVNMAKHEHATIRQSAAYALGSSWSEGVDGAVETIIALMSDSDDNVRKAAYGYAGDLGDESVIDPIVEMLNNPEEVDMHSYGVDSLVTLWFDFPFHEKTSEKAYNATMDYFRLAADSDNADIPYWTTVTSFNIQGDAYETWKEKATYFDSKEVVEVMTNIFKNENLESFARSGAIETISIYGTIDDLKALKPIIDSVEDEFDRESYLSDYNEAIAEMSK